MEQTASKQPVPLAYSSMRAFTEFSNPTSQLSEPITHGRLPVYVLSMVLIFIFPPVASAAGLMELRTRILTLAATIPSTMDLPRVEFGGPVRILKDLVHSLD